MVKTKVLFLIIFNIVIINLSASQDDFSTTSITINVTGQDNEFTDFKERSLPMVVKMEIENNRTVSSNLLMLFYAVIAPIIGLVIFSILMFCCVRGYRKWKKARIEAYARRRERKRSRSKSLSRKSSLEGKKKDKSPPLPVEEIEKTPSTTKLTPIEDLISKSLTALAGGVKSGRSLRTPPPARDGVIIPNSNSRSEGSISDRKETKETTEESIDDDLEQQSSLVLLRPIKEVGSIRN